MGLDELLPILDYRYYCRLHHWERTNSLFIFFSRLPHVPLAAKLARNRTLQI